MPARGAHITWRPKPQLPLSLIAVLKDCATQTSSGRIGHPWLHSLLAGLLAFCDLLALGCAGAAFLPWCDLLRTGA